MVIPSTPIMLAENKEIHMSILILSPVLGLSDLETFEFFSDSSTAVSSEFFMGSTDPLTSKFVLTSPSV